MRSSMAVRALFLTTVAAGAATGAALGQSITEDIQIFGVPGLPGDQFGSSVAIEGGIVAVGANQASGDAGLAYLFDGDPLSAGFGTQLLRFWPNDAMGQDYFGSSIAMSGGIVAVGALLGDGLGFNTGSAYLFDADPNSATFGDQFVELMASNGSNQAYFGSSIDFDDGLVAVGARGGNGNVSGSGAAYLFDGNPLSPTFGDQLEWLVAGDGSANDSFGLSIAIGNGIVAVGAPIENEEGFQAGAVYLFDGDIDSERFGKEIMKITAGVDAGTGHWFGQSVAISDGVLVVGELEGDGVAASSGAAYVYSLNDGTFGELLVRITASDGAFGDQFGGFIAMDEGLIVVGATRDDDQGTNSGSAYVFKQDGTQLAKLAPSSGPAHAWFGGAVAVEKGVVVVGKPEPQTAFEPVYIFDLNCPADLTGDFMLNFLDVSAFLAAYGNQDPIADFNGDTAFNFLDVSAFLAAYGQGCP